MDSFEDHIRAAQRAAEDRIEEARRSGASSLDLSGLWLGSLPHSLGDLTALTRLNLAGNRLTVLPESLGNLTALTGLGLTGNRLTVLPESLGNLTALTWLDLAGNRLTVLPEWLGNLTALTRLDLTGNQLTALPASLGNLTALTKLFLADNRLTALPESLGDLAALTRLDLAGNQITVLPEWLRDPTANSHSTNASLRAWIDDTSTTVASAADLDALLDRVPGGGVSLTSEDGERTLFVNLAGDQSGLVWEDAGEGEIMLSWGPVPPGAPPGQTVSDAEYAYSDPWFTAPGTEPPFDLSADQVRRAGREFLRTGRRPTNVQWFDKP